MRPSLALSLLALATSACVIEAPTRLVHEATLTLDDPVEAVRLDQGTGDVEIRGADVDAVTLSVRLLGPEDRLSQDQRVIDDLILELQACEGRACARTDLADAHARYALRTELVVPRHVHLQVDDDLGDLSISGVASVDLEDGSGDLDIRDIAGEVRVDDDLGDLQITAVGGALFLTDGSGDAQVQDVDGAVDIDDDLGDLQVARTGPATIRDGSGDLDVEDIRGDVTIDDDLGDLTVRRVDGSVDIKDGSGSILVEVVSADVAITDDGGDITVRHVQGTLTIRDDGAGDLQTEDVGAVVVE